MQIINKINKVIFFITLFLMSVVFAITKNSADADLWHRMAVGKIFSQLGNVVYHDIFSYFPTKPIWVDHEWLSGVVFYNTVNVFGDWGLSVLKILITFSIIFLIYKTNQLIHPESHKYRISFYFVTLVAIILGILATLRCQAFTYLFFTLWIYLLERIRRGENRLIWIFPATTLIWANMHAGFVAGFGLLVFYAAGEFFNKKSFLKYIGILALCVPFTFINPYGVKYWQYLMVALTMHRPNITEWAPLQPFKSIFTVIGTKLQLLLLIPSLIYTIFFIEKKKFANHSEESPLTNKNFDMVAIIAFLATFYLAMKHCRHIVFFSIIIGVFGYKYFALFSEAVFSKIKAKIFLYIPENRYLSFHIAKFAIIYGVLINICLITIFQTSFSVGVDFYPTRAVEFIKINKLGGNLLVPFNWGSYAMWKLYPQNLISMDGRYEESYTNEAYKDISTITFVRNDWEKTFLKYHHDVVLMYKDKKFEKSLIKMKKWKIVYEDKQAVIFIPASMPDKKWLKPKQDEKYYVKTKYENDINF